MLIEIALAFTAALAWSMVVWHVGKGQMWPAQQQRAVFWVGCILLSMLVFYLMH